MKNKIYFILLIGFFSLLGCSKQLDTKPTSDLDASDAIKTSADILAILKGAYSDLGSGSFFGGDVFVESELLADGGYIIWSGTFEELTQINNKRIPVNNSFVTSNWLAGYKVINDANVVLDNLTVVVDAEKEQAEAEAKFIRGISYFELVSLFGKAWNDGDPTHNPGVPIVLKSTDPTKDLPESAKVARSTVAEVYTQVISDLTDAESKLPETNGFYATKAAAAAMLARVYLQKADYTNAAKEANTAIQSATDNGLHLTATYADAFPTIDPPDKIPNTTEDVFSIQVTKTSGVNDFQTYFSELNRGDITIDDSYFDLYEEGDDRANLFYEDNGSTYSIKFENIYGNIHTIRLAELYLIRAEANFRLGTSVGASPASDINMIRERAGLKPVKAADLTLDDILMERKLELAFEGFTLNDIKRLQQDVSSAFPWSSPKLIFPIPERELRINTNLTQNEGY